MQGENRNGWLKRPRFASRSFESCPPILCNDAGQVPLTIVVTVLGCLLRRKRAYRKDTGALSLGATQHYFPLPNFGARSGETVTLAIVVGFEPTDTNSDGVYPSLRFFVHVNLKPLGHTLAVL